MSSITLYHNPRCGTSRTVLATIREHGIEPQIIGYLKTPPSREQLRALIDASGRPAREFVRSKEALFSELGLGDPALSDEQLIEAMASHPILINRPIVVSPLGTRLCRPADSVNELLPPA